MSEKKSGLARSEDVGRAYLESRTLRRSAGWVLLCALGDGAVTSGDFYGWQFGLSHGGFWGLAIATVAMAVMYVCMVFSIAELSTALPHAGGFYWFVRNAMGPTAGFIRGLTDTIEYVITPAVVVVGIGGYLTGLLESATGWEAGGWEWVWWLAAYAVFVRINVLGVELTLKVGLAITLAALAVLAMFHGSVLASGEFESGLLFDIAPESGRSATWLPRGWSGAPAALPFANWFYLTPHLALTLGAFVGLAYAFAIYFTRGEADRGHFVGQALRNMAVFGAVISDAMVMLSYIVLRVTRPDLPRPYRSPLGIPGAALGTLLALTALAATFFVGELRPAIWGVTLFLAAGALYFLVYSRYRLVAQAPEEAVALLPGIEIEGAQ
jgi:amino acid transporter